ncbi:galactose-binding like protein [Lizonia empirigonia]|nr:galactose-binding like protein [Lizonia empirigonia]
MRTTSIFAALATAKTIFAKGPFLKQISLTQWIIGNDLWNVTQGETYATNLQYQGSGAVGKAQGHYAGYDGESNLVYTSATVVSNSSDFIDVSFASSLGDLHWVIYPDLTTSPSSVPCGVLIQIASRMASIRTRTRNCRISRCTPMLRRSKMRRSCFLMEGSYVTKYDFANYVRERDLVGIYGNETESWYIHPTNEYQPGNHLSQTLTLNVVQDTSHFRVGVKTPQPVGKIWGPWLWYLNNGSVSDARTRAAHERATFSYAFLNNTAYHSRRSIKGKLALSDGRPAAGAAVFLGDTDTSTRPLVQGSNYYYTTFADASGSFSIPNVRSGSYGLIAALNGGAIGDVYTNFTSSPIVISKGKTSDVGRLTWQVPAGRQNMFQIGAFDKKASGFTNSGPHVHGLTEKSPANLTFTVGTSKPSDWYYASSRLGTWDVVFNATRPNSGTKALLSVSLAGYSQSTSLTIYLNGNKTVGNISKDILTSDPALYRSGTISGEWRFLQYEIAAGGVKEGSNVLSFTTDRYTLWRGVLWDSIILEWVL